jgi:hypothetical protein
LGVPRGRNDLSQPGICGRRAGRYQLDRRGNVS